MVISDRTFAKRVSSLLSAITALCVTQHSTAHKELFYFVFRYPFPRRGTDKKITFLSCNFSCQSEVHTNWRIPILPQRVGLGSESYAPAAAKPLGQGQTHMC